MIDIISLLSNDGFIMCNKTIIKLFGTDSAVILGELCAEYNYYKDRNELEEDSFYSTQSNIEINTGLSEHLQRKAINVLKANGIISVVKKGLPAKNYFHINTDELLKIFTLDDSSLNFKPLDVKNLNLNNKENKNKENNSKELLEKPHTKKSSLFSSCNEANNDNTSSETNKPKRKSLYVKCLDMINKFTMDVDTIRLLKHYLDMRLAMKDKPMYANQWQGLLNKLDKLADTEQGIRQIVTQSIELGYASFFPYNPNIGKGGGQYGWHNDAANANVKSSSMTEQELKEFENDIERRKQEGERVVY